MVSGFLDRHRAERLMAEQGLDALVLAQPETLTYATGAFPGVASFWRRAGAAFLIVPGDANVAMSAIVGDLQAESFKAQSQLADVRSHRIWVETGDYDPTLAAPGDVAAALVARDMAAGKPVRTPRPAQFDLTASLGLLRDVLAERGLLRSRVGLELGFVAAGDFSAFARTMPDPTWIDATAIVERLRAIKHPVEIEHLRTAAELSQAAVGALVRAIVPGMDAARMTAIWREAVLAEALRRNLSPPDSSWAYIAVGGDGFAAGGPARGGDLIKIDVGCIIAGYSSDGARTAVLGKASPATRKLYDALGRGFDAGLAVLRPGTALRDVHRTVLHAMWDQGFTTYGRGHFGHGVGASVWSEEWPFISADATALAEPGMVLAFEVPYYIKGLGGFIIEDQLLVTESGVAAMAPSPRDLIEIACL
ncbi:MAG: aminopeptidase P family protein [Rhizobiales bacterium]|nr:aminopeptidase P family protein [Hyphomicrobiales bacterium]MBI3672320.1 aminopeptidase P family protein [Hyphomicrobiales bacterium]